MKQKILSLLVFIISINSYSQVGVGMQKTIGGNADDQLGGFWLTTDGGMILGGRSYSDISGDKTDYNRGIDDYWVVKLSRSGRIQWQRTIGGTDVDEMIALQQTSDGGYILAGNSQSNISGDKSENSKGFFDCWVVKLDNTGNIQWQKTLGGDSYEFCNSVQQTKDGGYIVGCMSASNISGDKSEDSKGNYDFWVVKLDGNGNKQWDKTLGGSEYEFVNQVIQTADGGYIAVGLSNSNISGDKSENSRGGYDYWAIKLGKNGKKMWDKTAGGSNDDYVNAVVQTQDGGYALAGASASNISGDKTQNIRGGQDYWLVKLGRAGNIQFDKTVGGINDDYGQSVDNTKDGGLIIGGSSSSPISDEKSENGWGYNDYWIVKIKQNGDIAWDKTIGGNGDDNLRTIKEIQRDKYMLGGFSWSDVSGDKTEASKGGLDYWMVNVNYSKPANATNVAANNLILPAPKNIQDKSFSVYPNPAKNILKVYVTGRSILTLYNMSGKIISTKTYEGNGDIDVSALPSGAYYLKNNATGAMQTVMIIK